MASLQYRSGSWRVIFRHNGLQHFVTVGEVEQTEAQGVTIKGRVPYSTPWSAWPAAAAPNASVSSKTFPSQKLSSAITRHALASRSSMTPTCPN